MPLNDSQAEMGSAWLTRCEPLNDERCMMTNEIFDENLPPEVVAVFPASLQRTWADQVFTFTETLRQEMERFDDADDALIEYVGNGYIDGSYDTAEQLRNRFFEIFNVTIAPMIE